ncbi:MAG: 1,4-dihydroxy-6-naphthoate synthase [Chitinophagaceae bacterium]
MKLSLGFSPCPNDTFIFDALVNHKIDTDGLEFETLLEDVETLNQWAMQGKLDITKLSFPAYFQSRDNYVLLHAGSALGKGVGPILLSRFGAHELNRKISDQLIAVPGLNTTANLLLSFAHPEANNKLLMVFSEIENAVLTGKTDFGVIIHENRFTYEQKGLQKVLDLGQYWEEKTNMPVPLGGIGISQSIKRSLALKINELLKKSVAYAFSNYPIIDDYVVKHSQEMDELIIRKHIELYVNNYTSNLGNTGKDAVNKLFTIYNKINNLENDENETSLFL